jgi:hypothetical protein
MAISKLSKSTLLQNLAKDNDAAPLSEIIPVAIDYLILAGGGGGASGLGVNRNGGGGGAGGYLTGSTTIYRNRAYVITVGAGGAGKNTSFAAGDQGSPSSAFGLYALGGGGGGAYGYVGGGGGSGGGSGDSIAYGGNGIQASSPYGSAAQGFNGGAGRGTTSYSGAGGGGGAGALGVNSTVSETGGVGGVGLSSSITGTSITRAGGGGGARYAAGGSNLGGQGSNESSNGGNAVANTGSGGGGSCNATGGNGSGGIVIVKSPIPARLLIGSPSSGVDGAFYIYQFTGDGSITF